VCGERGKEGGRERGRRERGKEMENIYISFFVTKFYEGSPYSFCPLRIIVRETKTIIHLIKRHSFIHSL
jgi:hypothetical protein